MVACDDELAKAIGLPIDVGRNLPDQIILDVGLGESLLVLVEAVASADPVSEGLVGVIRMGASLGRRDALR